MEDFISISPITLGMTRISFFGGFNSRTTKMVFDDSKRLWLYSQTHGRTGTGCIEIANSTRWEIASGTRSSRLTANFTISRFPISKSHGH